MTTKKTSPASAKVLSVEAESGQSVADKLAQTVSDPTVRAAVTYESFSKSYGELDLAAMVTELRGQAGQVHGGDLKRAESMLVAQAHTLDAIFNELARRAAMNLGEYMNASERYLRLALKAQGQCRATLEALAAIKNPPVIFAKQANIANGPQQVNNATSAPACEKTVIEQNELLERQDEQRLDSGKASTPSGADSQLEAVGAIQRPHNRTR